MPKNKVKLILNLCLIAAGTIPRGGTMTVDVEGEADEARILIHCKGSYSRVAAGIASLLDGKPDNGTIDAHAIQPYFAGLVAREVGMTVSIVSDESGITIEATPQAHRAAAGYTVVQEPQAGQDSGEGSAFPGAFAAASSAPMS